MKKYSLLIVIAFLTFVNTQAQSEKKLDSIVKTMQFYGEVFDIQTNKTLESQTNIQSDTIGLRYVLMLPEFIALESFKIYGLEKTDGFKFKSTYGEEDLLEYKFDAENRKQIFYIAKGLLIPNQKGQILVPSIEIIMKCRKPSDKKDFFGNVAYQEELTKITLKSNSLTLDFP